jgi:S1-C subfamily serine protease
VDVEGGRYVVARSVAEGSAAERAGILPGDWIVEIRRKPVLSEEAYKEAATGAAASEESVEVLVYTAGDAQRRLVVLK